MSKLTLHLLGVYAALLVIHDGREDRLHSRLFWLAKEGAERINLLFPKVWGDDSRPIGRKKEDLTTKLRALRDHLDRPMK